MKYISVALLIFILQTGCKEANTEPYLGEKEEERSEVKKPEWSVKEKELLMDDCTKLKTKGLPNGTSQQEYCDCYAEKVTSIISFKEFNEVYGGGGGELSAVLKKKVQLLLIEIEYCRDDVASIAEPVDGTDPKKWTTYRKKKALAYCIGQADLQEESKAKRKEFCTCSLEKSEDVLTWYEYVTVMSFVKDGASRDIPVSLSNKLDKLDRKECLAILRGGEEPEE